MSGNEPRSSISIVWCKTWEDVPVAGAECQHPSPECLTIGLRFDRRPRGRSVVMDGRVCMLCGRDAIGKLSLIDGLAQTYEEHGWNFRVAQRLIDLIRAHRAELVASTEPLPLMFHPYLEGEEFNGPLAQSGELSGRGTGEDAGSSPVGSSK